MHHEQLDPLEYHARVLFVRVSAAAVAAAAAHENRRRRRFFAFFSTPPFFTAPPRPGTKRRLRNECESEVSRDEAASSSNVTFRSHTPLCRIGSGGLLDSSSFTGGALLFEVHRRVVS